MDLLKFPSGLSTVCFLLLFTFINYSLSARNLGDSSPSHPDTHHTVTFYMPDVLSKTHPSSRPVTSKVNGQLPFSKPLGFYPPNGGVLIPSNTPISTQTFDTLPGVAIPFPARATLQDLEFGTVTAIDVDLVENSFLGSPVIGKASGMYVASSEDGSSHMMAMTVTSAGSELKDALRFFGVHRADVSESHIAVIGGTGKYTGANGYATVKTVNVKSDTLGRETGAANNKFLLFNAEDGFVLRVTSFCQISKALHRNYQINEAAKFLFARIKKHSVRPSDVTDVACKAPSVKPEVSQGLVGFTSALRSIRKPPKDLHE
ncbi:hypothetical protein RJ640_012973 [Escallonia rubra]|uniref:Dirigent protein n=1 Tax=Escallonia rubra TaxID=112253 RepID=A0AA88QZ25_9ASTE|nr:hypothetical protein RJ640_012973 [Escallonia rubra]